MNPDNIFSSQPIPYGYSWTIVSRAGDILHEIEQKFGERDKSFTLLGIELTSDTIPDIWFPGDRKHLIIQITERCFNDMNEAIFEVAHELVHFLCPKVLGCSTYLEEGLATYFAHDYLVRKLSQNINPTTSKYKTAMNLAKELLSYDSDIVKRLRLVEPDLSKITVEMIMNQNPAIPLDLATKLTTNFKYDL